MTGPAQITYHYERWRAVSSGILETALTTFLILIAVRVFEADATSKALVAGSGSFGMLFTPWLVSRVEAAGWTTSRVTSLLSMVGAVCFLVAAFVQTLPVFVICSVLGIAVIASTIPFLTQIYQDNYPAAERGQLFGRTVRIRVATAMIFGLVAGQFLADDMDRFPWLLLSFAAACGFSGWCFAHYPSRPLPESGSTHPFRALQYVRQDPIFRWTLISWMFVELANLMMGPLRVEYLANPRFNMTYDAATIALLTSVVPNTVRLMLTTTWGWFFDRMNFFAFRIILNLGFALGIVTFFIGNSMTGLVIGAVIFGIGNAGGDVAWSLWVTKFAPPGRVADYMSVHTFFTGIRGVIAPMIAFHMVGVVSIGTLGWISAGLIAAASLMLFPEVRAGRKTPMGTMPVDEIPK